MRILVTGASGLLGPYLLRAAAASGRAIGLARHGAELICDLAEPVQAQRGVAAAQPELVLHAAAMTDVESCEADPAAADRANRVATYNVAAALPSGVGLVYISTDQVYADVPGEKREGEEAPVNAYGASKLAGERTVLARPAGLVLRCNLFGPSLSPGRQSLSDWLVASLKAGRPITLFTDVLFSPLHMSTLSGLVLEAATRGLSGVYNLGCREGASKSSFARMVARRLGLSTASAVDGISAALPGRARRPRDLRLRVNRIEAALGRRMPTLEDEVAKL